MLGIALVVAAAAVAPADRAAFEREIADELRQRHPEAVEPFRRAEAARGAGDLEAAANAYNEVLAKAPDFSHAHRRLCQVRSELGRRRAALEACRKAVALDDSADNYATLAMVLVGGPNEHETFAADEAMTAARRAVELDPSSVTAHTVLCHVASVAEDTGALRRCSSRLRELAPDDHLTYTFTAVLAIAERRWSDARAALDRARELGLPAASYEQMRAEIPGETPAWRRWWWLGALGAIALAAITWVVWRRSQR